MMEVRMNMHYLVMINKEHIVGIVYCPSPDKIKEVKKAAKQRKYRILAEFETTLLHNEIGCHSADTFLEWFV